jgi:integrase
MARKAHPWWWNEEQGWYVNVAGRRHFLGKHPENAKPPKKSKTTKQWNAPVAIDLAFRMLLQKKPSEQPKGDTVIAVLDQFIKWTYQNRARGTAKGYEDFTQDFVKAKVEGHQLGTLPVSMLTPAHVTVWLNQHPQWGSTYRRSAITAIQRGLNWACKNLGLPRNPIRGMEKPIANKRTTVLTPEEFQTLIKAIPDFQLRELLEVSYDTGARPQEIKHLEARHIQTEKQRAVIPAMEAKGKVVRTIYFDASWPIIHRLVSERPQGKLLINKRGNPWTAYAVKNRLEDLEDILGRRICHYALRHSRITDWLVSGVDSHVVAKLSGHKDSSMLDQTYSHVQDDYEFMLQNARKRTTPKTDTQAA